MKNSIVKRFLYTALHEIFAFGSSLHTLYLINLLTLHNFICTFIPCMTKYLMLMLLYNHCLSLLMVRITFGDEHIFQFQFAFFHIHVGVLIFPTIRAVFAEKIYIFTSCS